MISCTTTYEVNQASLNKASQRFAVVMVKAASYPIWERCLRQGHGRRWLPTSAKKNDSLSRRMTSTAQALSPAMIGRRTWAGAKIDIPVAKAFSTSPQAGRGQSVQVANAKHGWQTNCFRPADQVLQTKPCVMGVTIHNMILSWHMQYQHHASFHIWFTPFQGCWRCD